MVEKCPRSRVVDKTPPTRALCADGGGTPAQPRCRQDVADASAVLRSQGSARAAASPTGCRRCECCVPIARGAAGESVLGADRLAGGLPRVVLPFGRGRCGCAQGRERAASRACAFPARTASRRVSWTLFPPWLQVDLSRARKPRLFETRSSARGVRPPYAGIRPFGDGSGNGFGRSSGPDLPAPPLSALARALGLPHPRAPLPKP